jgi:hypothetical protein
MDCMAERAGVVFSQCETLPDLRLLDEKIVMACFKNRLTVLVAYEA